MTSTVGLAASSTRRPRRDAGLRRHPHPLRRPGLLGQAGHTVVVARRDDGCHGQLWRRLRTRAAGDGGRARRPDGGRRGHPGHRPARGHPVGVGDVRAVPRHDRHALQRRRRRPDAPRRAALLRDGRPLLRGRHRGRHRADGRAQPPRARRRCARLLHVALLRAPQQGRRGRARHARRGRRDDRHRRGPARQRPRHDGDHLRLLRRPRRAVVGRAHRPSHRPAGDAAGDGDRRQRAVAHGVAAGGRGHPDPAAGRGPAGVGPDDARGHAQPAAPVRHVLDDQGPADRRAARRPPRPGVP